MALGGKLEAIEAPKAKERQGTRTDLQHPGKFPESPKTAETRDVVGAAVGVSGKTPEEVCMMTGPYRLSRGDLEGLAAAIYIPRKGRADRHYADSFSSALHLAKSVPEVGMEWAADLSRGLVELVPEGTTLIATPPAGRRRVLRGWYLARELGACVARLTGLPLALPLRWGEEGEGAESSKAIQHQAGKGRALGRGAICDEDLTGQRLCLVDDLATTMITAELCAQALRIAGAESVFVVTLGITERTAWRPQAERDLLKARAGRKRAKQAGGGDPPGSAVAWREACFERDGRRCVVCGSEELLTVHHCWPQNARPDLRRDVRNGRTLCEGCHQWIHSPGGRLQNRQWQAEALVG